MTRHQKVWVDDIFKRVSIFEVDQPLPLHALYFLLNIMELAQRHNENQDVLNFSRVQTRLCLVFQKQCWLSWIVV